MSAVRNLLSVLTQWGQRRRSAARHLSQRKRQPLLADALQDAIFKSANFSCIACDAEGVIQIFNVGAERMLGYEAADVVDHITPSVISDAAEMAERAVVLSREFNRPITPGFEALVFKATRAIEDIYELSLIRKDGSRFPAILSVTALRDAHGHVIGYLLIGTDNTTRKQAETAQALLDQALQDTNVELKSAKAAAEKANQAKSDFLSSMSHELRSPLNAVLGFAQVLASEKNPPPSVEQRVSIDQILQAGWYLLRLINEILDLSMIESGKISLSQEAMLLSDVLADCEGMISPQAITRGILVTFPVLRDTGYVQADRTRLKQVMLNLLSNAIKYNREGGAVIVECAVREPGRMRISVRDTGPGLAPDQLTQLFQPFNRLGRENGNEEGTGIGLVVTKQLVELMDGTMGVDSAVGIGSVFWFELAVASAPELIFDQLDPLYMVETPKGPDHAESPKRNLLYIEDNPANMALVEKLISRRDDLTLLKAIDGYQGIRLARLHLPDIILMDINLPGVSGFGALAILRQDKTTAHIPVLALSANAVPRDIEKGLEAGFFRYLTKPIKVNEFMDALDLALQCAAEDGTAHKAV